MKAVILVGGKATRLLPLTCNTPKAMVPVLNKPFLEYVIRHLSRHGIKEIVLAQGHLAQSIEDYLGDGTQFGVSLHYSFEDAPLGTAGAVKNAERYLNDTFVVLNGDVFTDLDITAMIDLHRQKKAKLTIALTPVDDPTSYGLIETSADGKVMRFIEKPTPNEVTTNMINAGTYIMEPDILSRISPQTPFSFEHQVFPQLAEKKVVYAFPSSAYWLDIGTPEKYFRLHRDLLTGKCPEYAPEGKVTIGKGSNVHTTAQIKGLVSIGANCSIGRRVKISGMVVIGSGGIILEDSVIEDVIIWRNATLGQRVYLKKSLLADNCHLSEDSVCENAVLGDNVTIASGGKVEPGSKISPDTMVEAKA
jgi:mannose-1-phosphate guanylyltransferase